MARISMLAVYLIYTEDLAADHEIQLTAFHCGVMGSTLSETKGFPVIFRTYQRPKCGFTVEISTQVNVTLL